MRVKLHLEQYLGKKKRKVCLLIDEEKFHNVSDLCHMIYQQHFKDDIPPGYSNRHGKVSLYLDGYYIRQSESINIIHHDDVITARYEAYDGEVNEIEGSKRKKNGSNQLSNSMLSSSNEVSSKKPKLDNGTKKFNANGQSLKLPEKVNVIIKTSNKKPIKTTPLSKLAIQSKESSDSSSSSSSDSDSSSPSVPSPSSKKDPKPKENKKFPLAQKKGTPIISKKVSETISSSSSSASSSSSSESSSSSSNEEDNNIKNIEQNKKETKSKKLIKPTKTNIVTNKNYTKVKRVDFNVAELPSGSTSTPSLVNNIRKPKNNKRTKDVYKNSSVVIYNDSNKKTGESVEPPNVKAVEQPNVEKVEQPNVEAVEQPNVEAVEQQSVEEVELRNVIPLSSLKSNPSLSISNELKVSSKTLRNRRRRQKRTNLKKAAQESVAPCNEEMENESSVSKTDVVDDSNGNKTNEEMNNEVNEDKETLENDFSKYEPLKKIPDIGDVIAFKILEMSMSYTPEVSSYKKAMVFDVNERSGDLILELTKDSLTVPKGDGTENRRFEFDEDINDNNTSEEDDHNHHLHIKWSALLEPVLIQKRQDVIVL